MMTFQPVVLREPRRKKKKQINVIVEEKAKRAKLKRRLLEHKTSHPPALRDRERRGRERERKRKRGIEMEGKWKRDKEGREKREG